MRIPRKINVAEAVHKIAYDIGLTPVSFIKHNRRAYIKKMVCDRYKIRREADIEHVNQEINKMVKFAFKPEQLDYYFDYEW